MATANTSSIQLVHRHFSSEKCVDPLNAANIFNVHAFLHGICKQGHRFEVVNSQEESENEHSQYLAVCTNFGWFLVSWYLAVCQIFCCSIFEEVSFNPSTTALANKLALGFFGYNSPAAIARELFKPSTDAARLLGSI